jgi:phospholipase/carboxylesterase
MNIRHLLFLFLLGLASIAWGQEVPATPVSPAAPAKPAAVIPEPQSKSFLPKDLQAGEKVPLIIYLHGYGSCPDRILALLTPLATAQRFAVLAPCGSKKLAVLPDGLPGYGWEGQTDIPATVKEIRTLIAAGSVDPERVYLMGFSMGGNLAYVVGLKNPGLFAGLIIFSSALQKEFFTADELKAAAAKLPVFIVQGSRDQAMGPQMGQAAYEFLKASGFRARFFGFPGGHQMPNNYLGVMREAIDWCDAQRLTLGGETVAEAVARMKSELPEGYAVRPFGRLVVGSNWKVERVDRLAKGLLEREKSCLAVTGKTAQQTTRAISLYCSVYSKTETGWELFRGIMKREPPHAAVPSLTWPPIRLFSFKNVSDTALSRELVRAVAMEDWPDLPGWLNEALAVTLSDPKVSVSTDKFQSDDQWLLAALKAIEENKWTTVGETLRHTELAYGDLDQTKVTLFAGYEVNVGPLNTGRMLVRWLAETGKLPQFYQAYRDSRDAGAALKTATTKDVEGVEKELAEWVKSHKEGSLLKKAEHNPQGYQ